MCFFGFVCLTVDGFCLGNGSRVVAAPGAGQHYPVLTVCYGLELSYFYFLFL